MINSRKYCKRYMLIFLITLLTITIAKAVEPIDTLKKIENTPEIQRDKKDKKDFIEEYNYKTTIKLTYAGETNYFNLSDKNKIGKTVMYQANIPATIGIGVSYRFLYLGYSYKLPQTASVVDKLGDTKYNNFKIGIQTRRFGFNLFFRNYKGFFLSNPKSFEPNWNQKVYPQRNDMSAFTLGFNSNIIFSGKFSVKAAFDNSERQKKSAASFMIMWGDYVYRVYNDSTLIPYPEQLNYPLITNFRKGTYNTFFVAPGFGFTIAMGPFYITPVVYGGAGAQYQSYVMNNKRDFMIKFPLFFNTKCAIGFNSGHFFTSISGSYEMNEMVMGKTGGETTRIRLNRPTWEGNIGFRF